MVDAFAGLVWVWVEACLLLNVELLLLWLHVHGLLRRLVFTCVWLICPHPD